ncbi:restriction endonuclease subunit S [Methylobacterium bullatum]|uniref:Type I restriction modification DNA specificity domain-containing protein n=1 Tax=Methylobacterium bullatum TaxID=570505 RepID=A0AAV4ZDS6_9HYPH|nr:restriction endonuclease subunit S [Methylobacterium bullatum]MBD8903777.1 hypothetical protein [Methylobacterium bullatum]GJD41967.1 hypothetical protein OICFNHDK_4458 [Methylobacterium bullatum]
MLSNTPKGWQSRPLKELARHISRGAAPRYAADETSIWAVSQKCVRDGTFNLTNCRPHDGAKAVKDVAYLQVGDICINSTGTGTLGRVAQWQECGGRYFADTHITIVRPDTTKALPAFLVAFLGMPSTKAIINRDCVTGSTNQIELSKTALSELIIPVPPLDEQRRIAEVLKSVDDCIALSEEALEATSAKKNALLVAILHAGLWPIVQVGSLLADTPIPMRSGPFGSALLKSELTETGIPLLGIDNVHAERFKNEYRRFISEEKYRELARYTVFPGDVMVTIMGTVGRCCMVPEDIGRAISSKHVWTLSIDKTLYSSALLAWQINHDPRVLEQLRGAAQGGIMSAISSETLRNLRVPQPPQEQMLELEQLIVSANSTIFHLEEGIASLNRLKQLVSSDILSGRVRVPVANIDAPARRAIQPAFKRAVFAAEIVHQLHQDERFGSVKHEKIVYICELHLSLQIDLDRHAYKEAAGPYDPSARRSVEKILRQQKWYDSTKQDNRVVYAPLEASGGHARYFDRYFGERRSEVQELIDLLRPLKTQQCEIVATLYAVWNDFLIDGRQPSDDEIVDGVLNDWTDSKRQVPEEKWRAALPWMREKNLIPVGRGEKTRVPAK